MTHDVDHAARSAGYKFVEYFISRVSQGGIQITHYMQINKKRVGVYSLFCIGYLQLSCIAAIEICEKDVNYIE